jgi:hypothetical protein
MVRPLSQGYTLPAIVISEILTRGIQLVLASLQLFFGVSDFLPVVANLATVLSDLFSARAALNISFEIRSILLQLVDTLLKLLSIFCYVPSGFADVADIFANLTSSDILADISPTGISRTIEHVVAKAAVAELAVRPTPIVGN